MKLELFLMFLCFLLASFVVLADETDNGHKDDDHVQQAEDARWGRRKGRRKPGHKQDWPWQKKTALEDQQFFDWPWSKRKATDIKEDEKLWPWQSDVTKEDEKLWPWLSSDVTKEEGKTLEDEALQLVS
ncbi:uncharacterized protein LOC110056503 isoform X2 [Orbicella faveolata]|uniref:uncharacterized protein LOC110056503 isoform X2 n=1 Tax=Orbicella faveolata TaxID=48498 RepID=UPI0009E53F13|nr:uncharacterized protein LOC110056503 isoform X2 [Orbicella faveolata]